MMTRRFRDGHTGLPESAKDSQDVSSPSEQSEHFDPYPTERIFPPDSKEVEPGVRIVTEGEHADSERRQRELLRMDIARSYRKIDDSSERERLRQVERVPPDPLREVRDHLSTHRSGMKDETPDTFGDTILPTARNEDDPAENLSEKQGANRDKLESRMNRRVLSAGKKRRGYEYDEESMPTPKASKKEKISTGIRSWLGSFRRPKGVDRKTGDRPLRKAKRRGLVE